MRHVLIAILGTGLLTTPAAFAETSNDHHTVTLSYKYQDDDTGVADVSVVAVAIEGRFRFSPRFSLGYDARLKSLSVPGGGSGDISDVELSPRFHVNDQLWIGAYAARASYESPNFHTNAAGLQIGYDDGAVSGAFSMGRTETGPVKRKINNFSLRLGYAPADNWEIFGSALYSDFKTGDEMRSVGFGGAYTFKNGVSLFGGLEYIELVSDDATQGALGVSYTFRQAAVPVTLSGELSHTGDYNRIGVYLSIPVGGTKVGRVPHGSATGKIRKGYRDPFDAFFNSYLFP
ncbi:MAG: hypothetical protein CSA68_12445 [Rhodobacterales bacterium]|nr:MAG: hypothetical protein CSA68_12445 [Rhodobacterales bacterium]